MKKIKLDFEDNKIFQELFDNPKIIKSILEKEDIESIVSGAYKVDKIFNGLYTNFHIYFPIQKKPEVHKKIKNFFKYAPQADIDFIKECNVFCITIEGEDFTNIKTIINKLVQ